MTLLVSRSPSAQTSVPPDRRPTVNFSSELPHTNILTLNTVKFSGLFVQMVVMHIQKRNHEYMVACFLCLQVTSGLPKMGRNVLYHCVRCRLLHLRCIVGAPWSATVGCNGRHRDVEAYGVFILRLEWIVLLANRNHGLSCLDSTGSRSHHCSCGLRHAFLWLTCCSLWFVCISTLY